MCKTYVKQYKDSQIKGQLNLSQTETVKRKNNVAYVTALAEYERLSFFNHPNIIKCHGFCESDKNGDWCILLDYARHGDLEKYYKTLGVC